MIHIFLSVIHAWSNTRRKLLGIYDQQVAPLPTIIPSQES